jgi:hypothetical protein
LVQWLDDGDEGLDAHLATCNRCAAILETIDAQGPDLAPGPELGAPSITQALAIIYQAPSGLPQRVEQGVVARLDALAMLGVVADLFQAGFETGGLLFNRPDGPDEIDPGSGNRPAPE